MTEAYRIEGAANRREQAEAALHRSDGLRVYGDAEHKERMAAIKAQHCAEFDAIDAEVGRKVAAAEEALLVAENADPADALTTSELERANAKAAFVADDAERLPLDKLAQRCRAALASGDRPTMFLLIHNADRSVRDEADERRGAATRRRGDELREAWRQHHLREERDGPKRGKP